MRRAAITVVAGLVLSALAAIGIGGWYYSDELLAVPDATAVTDQVTLTQVDPERGLITLDIQHGDAVELATVGLQTPEAALLLEGPARHTEHGVIRAATLMDGEWPRPGATAQTDADTFPGSPGEVLGFPSDEIDVEGELGILPAWRVIPAGDVDDVWAVIVHGRGARRSQGNRLLSTLDELRIPSLAISMRNDPGVASPEDGYGRYGDTEWRDLDAAIDHLVAAEGAERFVLVGYSQGASTAMTFLRRSDHAPRVIGSVYVSPLVSLHETLELQARQRDIPGFVIPPLLTATKWISSARAGIDFDGLEHHRHVERMPDDIPTLITHGTADTEVPPQPSRWLADALGDDALFVEYPGADHVREWNDDRTRFEDDFASFLSAEVVGDAARR